MLDDIVAYKKHETESKEKQLTISQLKQQIKKARSPRNFKHALSGANISLIAEVKKKSPSKGILKENFNHLEIAKLYQKAGVSAISVLGDEHFFAGSSEIVRSIASNSDISVPVMFKDFIASEYQLYEARASNADAVLLIVRILDQNTLKDLIAKTHELGMSALVETFDESDVKRALEAGAEIIGINNRDLDTFKTDFEKTRRLMELIPDNIITVSESGIHTREDVLFMESLGFNAMLIGESIICQEDIPGKISEIMMD
ncbi:indole-3-glycerol phosphate synthase TrpC [Reinekea forsetii]|jgi:indole-3-glycerol phosphate synthase|uniref:Indole-3-glycerol phosphate synthase n=1 Tax=Reinekea forsetii TaxID=1336806 RepID=A0A2K8KSK4_9GAMM|nr:indole-3-glycerol phosphate synthase TrpC [Reinekea forsetii]ATX77059.1 indole-3-glycerol phosphate synthase [Reinekea forsetii]